MKTSFDWEGKGWCASFNSCIKLSTSLQVKLVVPLGENACHT